MLQDKEERQPDLLEALGDHMLEVFLLANLLTGAVNMTIDTRAAGNVLASATLTAYSAVLCWAALHFRQRGVRLRWSQLAM